MSLICNILASHLLVVVSAPKADVDILSCALGDPFYRNIGINFDGDIDHIGLDINETQTIHFKKRENWIHQGKKKYEVFTNGTLMIKNLANSDSGKYSVGTYNRAGKHKIVTEFILQVQEKVSEPNVSFSCDNETLTCQAANGIDTELELFLNGAMTSKAMEKITYKINKEKTAYQCIARNKVSNKTINGYADCSGGEVLDLYLILGICGAGTMALLFVTLLLVYISRRRKQTRQRRDEVEIRVRRVPTEARGQKPSPGPGSAPNPASAQPPPPPAHRPQTPGHHPQAPGQRLRVPNQQQKVPLPPVPHVHQHKGPPLPTPRAQPKPPRGPKEHP